MPDWSYQSVSSDGVRGEVMAEMMKNTGCDRDKAYAATLKSGPTEYA
jgi:hypothetical protein